MSARTTSSRPGSAPAAMPLTFEASQLYSLSSLSSILPRSWALQLPQTALGHACSGCRRYGIWGRKQAVKEGGAERQAAAGRGKESVVGEMRHRKK